MINSYSSKIHIFILGINFGYPNTIEGNNNSKLHHDTSPHPHTYLRRRITRGPALLIKFYSNKRREKYTDYINYIIKEENKVDKNVQDGDL